MQKTDLKALAAENAFELIGKEWMLVAAGTPEHFNMMTASWGGIGWLWNKPVAFVFVRPERYTYQFTEREDRMTLSFLGTDNEDMRRVMNFCGTASGRDHDKQAETGLTPVATEGGSVAFAEARLTVEGRKLFRSEMQAAHFLDKAVLERWYHDGPGGSLHTVYVIEIENVYTR